MKFTSTFLFIYLAGACMNVIECLEILHPSNGADKGDWGSIDSCAAGGFATGIEMRSDGHTTGNNDGLFEDHVGATAFRLYCGGEITGISSLTCGNNGDWLPVWHCPAQSFVVGFQQNVNPGISDELGIENIRVLCSDTTLVTYYVDAILGNLNGTKIKENDRNVKYGSVENGRGMSVDDAYWSPLLRCTDPTSFVCALQTRVAQNGVFKDNICLADMILFCC